MTPRRTKSHTHEETGITVTMTVLNNGELADLTLMDEMEVMSFLGGFVSEITDADGNSIDFDDLDGDITQEAFAAIMTPPDREAKKDSPSGSRRTRRTRAQNSQRS